MPKTVSLSELLDRRSALIEQGKPASARDVCADCPEMEEAFRSHVDHLNSIRGRIEPGSDSDDYPQTPTPPPAIPGYEIEGEGRAGGMGVVYKARHAGLNRYVALKTIRGAAHASAEERRRFRTEGEALARQQHPHVIQVFEVGTHAGLDYLALEWCPGGSLADRLDGKPLSAHEAAKLVEAVARGVEAAHQKKVLHRDLKPANVLFAEDGTAKVADFGLAKRLDEDGHTATGVAGTPAYMAPEQVAGGEASVASDVYGLGAILYECLTGQSPFWGKNKIDILLKARWDDPPPPRRLNRRVPRELEAICLMCLRKNPAKRYATAAAVADDLENWREGRPTVARPLGLLGHIWRAVRRYRWPRRSWQLSWSAGSWLLLTVASTIQNANPRKSRRLRAPGRRF